MSGIKLEAGQWYRSREGKIWHCVGKSIDTKCDSFTFVCEDKFLHCDRFCKNGWFADPNEKINDLIEHLPDCTGFDWEPPKPIVAPEGWRLLTDGEVILVGDICADKRGKWVEEPVITKDEICGEKWDNSVHYAVARKIEPKYRPFANADEFRSFRNEWIKYKKSDSGKTMRCVSFSAEWIIASCSFFTYDAAFDSLLFEDGTPFGVRVDD